MVPRKKYGYIWWNKEDDSKFRKVFPKGKFTVEIAGEKIPNRSVDWKRMGVSIGKNKMNSLIKGSKIIIFRESKKLIKIKEK